MGYENLDFLKQFITIPWAAGAVIVITGVLFLAKFTDAIKKLHDFGKAVKSEFGPKEEWKQQFAILRRNVLYCELANDIPIHLHKLRLFLIETGLVEKPQIKEFFEKWLSEPPVLTGTACTGLFTNKQLQQLTDELRTMQL